MCLLPGCCASRPGDSFAGVVCGCRRLTARSPSSPSTCSVTGHPRWPGPPDGYAGRTSDCPPIATTRRTPCARHGVAPRRSGWRLRVPVGVGGPALRWPALPRWTACRRNGQWPSSGSTTARKQSRHPGNGATSVASPHPETGRRTIGVRAPVRLAVGDIVSFFGGRLRELTCTVGECHPLARAGEQADGGDQDRCAGEQCDTDGSDRAD